MLQCLYLVVYGVAICYTGTIAEILERVFGLPTTMSFIITASAMCGVALRLYFLTGVGLNHPNAPGMFRQAFPMLLLLDTFWATSPLLLWDKILWGTLVCVVAMAPLPFTQRTLMLSAYPDKKSVNRQFRIARTWFAALVVLCVTQEARAAKLQPGTLKTWDAYVQLTEKRIDAELAGKSSFLVMDFKRADESRRIRSLLMSGQVFMEKMKTTDAGGRELAVDDGMIHHWFGAIFLPNTTLDVLLRWVQDYDQHQRFFKEVEQSRLVSRDNNTFNIFLRLMRKKVVTVHYNTNHTVVYREESDRRLQSQCCDQDRGTDWRGNTFRKGKACGRR